MFLQLHETDACRRFGGVQNGYVLLPLKYDCVVVAGAVGTERFQYRMPHLKAESTDGMPAADFVSFKVPEQVRRNLLQRRFSWRRNHVVDIGDFGV